jgi:hypothetical protein
MVFTVVKPNRAALIGVVLWAAAAQAHPEMSPQLVNRYLSIILVGDRLEYFATYLHGPLPAVQARRQLDADHDGRLSEAERVQGETAWRQRAAQLLSLQVDGREVALDDAKAEVQLGNDATTGAAPLVVEVYGSQTISAGRHELRLEPRWDPPSLGETELTVDTSTDWELVKSRRAAGADEHLTRYTLQGPRVAVIQNQSATFVVQPKGSAGPRRRRQLVPMAIALLLVAAGGLTVQRLRRKRARSV